MSTQIEGMRVEKTYYILFRGNDDARPWEFGYRANERATFYHPIPAPDDDNALMGEAKKKCKVLFTYGDWETTYTYPQSCCCCFIHKLLALSYNVSRGVMERVA
jgi:hypothetical protein